MFVSIDGTGLTAGEAEQRLREHGVLVSIMGRTRLRLVTHLDIGPTDIERAVAAAKSAFAG